MTHMAILPYPSHLIRVQALGDGQPYELIAEGLVTQADVDRMKADWRAHLQTEWEVGQQYKPNKADWLDGAWTGLRIADSQDEPHAASTPDSPAEVSEIDAQPDPDRL